MDQLTKARRVLDKVTTNSVIYVIERGRDDRGRTMQVLMAPEENQIIDITQAVSIVCKWPLRTLGVYVKGTGFNVADHIAESIGHVTKFENVTGERLTSDQR